MGEERLHFLQWHITHRCNLRCVHCYQEDYMEHMPEAELLDILDQYTAYLKKIHSTGQINLTGGEPLFHPSFLKLATEIRRRDLRLAILTNGTLIDDEFAGKLADLHPRFVQISLDGTEVIHDAIRGNGNYRKAMNGIEALKRHNVKVLVSFTAQRSNLSCFKELAKECRKHQVDKLWWDRVVTDDPNLYLTTEEFHKMVKTASRIKKMEKFRYGRSMVSTSRALQASDPRHEDCYLCSAGKQLAIILANGDVMPCRRLPFVIGNLHDAPLEQILENSSLMHQLASPRIPNECRSCKRFLYCEGGARCVTYAQTGDLYAKDVNCFYK